MEELLRMEHISKRFGDFYANHDINLSVAKGEVHTLLGENGAGKSTLMNILIGLYQPTEGKIFLNGKEVRIESPSQAVKLGIGMVHQHFMLFCPQRSDCRADHMVIKRHTNPPSIACSLYFMRKVQKYRLRK